jgi:hypothetical protein
LLVIAIKVIQVSIVIQLTLPVTHVRLDLVGDLIQDAFQLIIQICHIFVLVIQIGVDKIVDIILVTMMSTMDVNVCMVVVKIYHLVLGVASVIKVSGIHKSKISIINFKF